MVTSAPPVAIVTGVSSGIGRATVSLLNRSGYRVFGTVRRREGTQSSSEGQGFTAVPVDLHDEASVRNVVRQVMDEAGRIDALVNNAGYALVGAVEDLPREMIRHQFEVNVFAPIHLCREVLPIMRRTRSGHIVNVSSLAGLVSVPMMGAYCATKFALEAFSDALRVEARPFGVRVSIVEPGPVITDFPQAALEASRPVLRAESVYQKVYKGYLDGGFETGGGATADQVARVIVRILRSARPRARYRVRWRDSFAAVMSQLIPRPGMDWILSRWMDLDVKT